MRLRQTEYREVHKAPARNLPDKPGDFQKKTYLLGGGIERSRSPL